MLRSKLAAAMPFAHLMGLATAQGRAKGKVTGRRAEEDDERDAEEDDEEEPKSRKAKGKAGRAEDDDADPDAEGDDPDAEDDDEEEPKSRKAKGKRAAEDEDDESAEEDEDDTAASRAVKADRRRCAAIVAHGFANGCAEQACVFAFDTNMSKSAAINALTAGSKAGGKPRGSSLAERMSKSQVKPVGSEGGSDAPAGMSANAAAIIRAAEAAGGRR